MAGIGDFVRNIKNNIDDLVATAKFWGKNILPKGIDKIAHCDAYEVCTKKPISYEPCKKK